MDVSQENGAHGFRMFPSLIGRLWTQLAAVVNRLRRGVSIPYR